MKTEYNLNTMKRRGHPLRERVSRGEIALINPLDIPDKEAKISKLSADEKILVINYLEKIRKEEK